MDYIAYLKHLGRLSTVGNFWCYYNQKANHAFSCEEDALELALQDIAHGHALYLGVDCENEKFDPTSPKKCRITFIRKAGSGSATVFEFRNEMTGVLFFIPTDEIIPHYLTSSIKQPEPSTKCNHEWKNDYTSIFTAKQYFSCTKCGIDKDKWEAQERERQLEKEGAPVPDSLEEFSKKILAKYGN